MTNPSATSHLAKLFIKISDYGRYTIMAQNVSANCTWLPEYLENDIFALWN